MAAGGEGEPNLTPFIDLFSVLISFLLMTAAWLQLEQLQVGIQPAPPPKDQASNQPDATPTPEEKKAKLSVTISKQSVTVVEDEKKTEVSKISGSIDKDRVRQLLTALKSRYPTRKDMRVDTEAGVYYGELITIYDLLLSTEWPEVGISTN